ncbi:hypothetical protein ACFV9C_42360 [Kribbella sp. NPDC059898]|uniref:hypothetical protein n=1 Tax=Kribbella sp. NPDC059898 TaxID=3346995 RepID=UPI003669ABCE
MRQIRFTTHVEITVDVPDTDENGRDLTDEDHSIVHAARRADSYLQTLIGEHGLRVAHAGMDALQDAEVIETPTQQEFPGVDLPDRQLEVLLSLLLRTRWFKERAKREDIDPLLVAGFVDQGVGGLVLTEPGRAAAQRVWDTLRARNPEFADTFAAALRDPDQ